MIEKTGIIYLQKDKFDFFYPQTGKMIEFKFVPEIIKDLEVINGDLLESLIKLFTANSKILPCDLAIVISNNASFIKDFTKPQLPSSSNQNLQSQATNASPEDLLKPQIDLFIEHVPFDDVTSVKFPLNNGVKVWATNQMFYQAIVQAFEKIGFKAQMVLPGVILDGNIGSKPTFDFVAANSILQQLDNVRAHNLLTKKVFLPIVEEKTASQIDTRQEIDNIDTYKKPSGKKSNKRLFMMLGIFIALIIVLIFVYIGSLSQNP